MRKKLGKREPLPQPKHWELSRGYAAHLRTVTAAATSEASRAAPCAGVPSPAPPTQLRAPASSAHLSAREHSWVAEKPLLG